MATGSAVTLPPPRHGSVDLLVIAGEHSGDEHAARMVAAARERRPNLNVAAIGGPQLAAAGAQLLHDLTASSVVGLVEVIRNYRYFRDLFDETMHWITMHEPRAVCFVDFPGFNLRLAAALRQAGLTRKGGGKVRALYYISPQIWAWKAKRRFAMARDLDALAVIFPFEVRSYSDVRLPVSFVGHPFLAPGAFHPVCHDPAGPVLLLPGSRVQAVRRIFPVLLAGFARARGELGGRRAVVLYPSDRIARVLRECLAGQKPELLEAVDLRPVPGKSGADQTPVAAAAVMTSSGTMSMHCALAGIPGAIAYRANPLTYLAGRALLKVPWLGISNLLLKEVMYPEFIQGAATPARIGREIRDCVLDPSRAGITGAQAERLRMLLGQAALSSPGQWLVRQIEG